MMAYPLSEPKNTQRSTPKTTRCRTEVSHKDEDWPKDLIIELYINEKYTLNEVRSLLKQQGFIASKPQYKHKFEQWEVRKRQQRPREDRRQHIESDPQAEPELQDNNPSQFSTNDYSKEALASSTSEDKLSRYPNSLPPTKAYCLSPSPLKMEPVDFSLKGEPSLDGPGSGEVEDWEDEIARFDSSSHCIPHELDLACTITPLTDPRTIELGHEITGHCLRSTLDTFSLRPPILEFIYLMNRQLHPIAAIMPAATARLKVFLRTEASELVQSIIDRRNEILLHPSKSPSEGKSLIFIEGTLDFVTYVERGLQVNFGRLPEFDTRYSRGVENPPDQVICSDTLYFITEDLVNVTGLMDGIWRTSCSTSTLEIEICHAPRVPIIRYFPSFGNPRSRCCVILDI